MIYMLIILTLTFFVFHYYNAYKLEKELKEYYKKEADRNFKNYLDIADRYLELKEGWDDDGDEWKRLLK